MSRISLWGAVLTILFFSTTMLMAEMVTDVETHGGYLYVVSTTKVEIFDLVETPPERIGLIFYANNAMPINAEMTNNRLFLYFYFDDDNNGIRIYDLGTPTSPNLILTVDPPESLIQGGFSANSDMIFNQRGQFMAYEDYLFFYASDGLETGGLLAYNYRAYRYHIPSGEMFTYAFWVSSNFSQNCDSYREGSLVFDSYFVTDGYYFSIMSDSTPYHANYPEVITSDPCFLTQNSYLTYYGNANGPYTPKDHLILSHWSGRHQTYSFLGSGVAFLHTWQHPGYFYRYSDFLCTYANKHGGSIGEITDDNSEYDVQEILVHNGEIYLSSYYTRSIPHSYYYQDWGIYINCQDYWEFYDLDTHPYGMAAANGVLYVAGEDRLYELPLAKPDTELPTGGIYSVKTDGTTFNISGWAQDNEGIHQVTVRLDHAYQFLADRKQGVCVEEEEEETGGHTRPVDPCHTWSVSVPISNIEPGTYTMKVIAEDMDGDFSVIHEQPIQIHSRQLRFNRE